MKKVLLATTALTLSAGIAAAEGHTGVKVSGSAEMGLFDNGTDDVQFFQDLDVNFSMSGETDNGLSFGATVDLDESNCDTTAGGCTPGAFAPEDDGGTSIFLSGDFGTLTMGDTDGAFDWALTEVAGGGSIADDHTIHAGYSGNSGLDGTTDGQVLRYDHSVGDFSFAVSLEQDVNGGANGDAVGFGVKGSIGDFGVGLGYQEHDNDDIVGVSLSANLGSVNAVLNWSDQDSSGDHIALGVTYSDGPLTLHANFGDHDTNGDGFGLAAGYDLGGGAEILFGYGDDDARTTWSLGVSMAF